MKKTIFLSFVAVALLFIACESADYELEKSIYMPDKEHDGLPAYTEWGYNTFGAYYERKIFIYNNNEVPAKVIHTDGISRFILKGGLAPADYNDYYYNGHNYYTSDMSLSFYLAGFHPENYTDLIRLNDTIIDLTHPDNRVVAVIGTDTTDMDVFNGKLYFKRAQHLYVDEEHMRVILSGFFGFQALVHGEPISISYGRFDVSIDEYDFANY